jgi:glycosylphosphatidylinositol transamidase (GPIT) subunit GPI8/ABC-type branched-subunit amino acid transport system substrate-binding protein
MKRIMLIMMLFIILSGYTIGVSSCTTRDTSPLRIGVLLPITGHRSIHSDEVLNWAVDNVNRSGGINSRAVELVYKDTSTGDTLLLAQELIDDSSIEIVIGPCLSSEVYDIAPMFIENKKILISPLSTAGDIFRAFGGERFFWRTCQSDVAQVRTILYILSSKGVDRISFIYEDGIYARTFSDWIGFFSMELGIELLNMVEFDSGEKDFTEVVNKALEGDPQYIVCVASSLEAVEIKRELDKKQSSAQLFFSDAAATPYLTRALGEAAEGLEGTSPSADPTTGFEIAYKIRFGHEPNIFAAETYDALLLAMYTLARQEYEPREEIQESIEDIVAGRGIQVGWDRQEMNEAIELILQGELPDISGASGSLEFDTDFGLDPLETFYCHWRVEAGDFRVVELIGSGQSSDVGIIKEGASAYRTLASQRFAELEQTGVVPYAPKSKKDLWAVILATSIDWENYRHQADALAVYDLLRENGVDDDHIILMLVDDIPYNQSNPLKGDVHFEMGGKNLRGGAIIDYSGIEVNVQNFKNILVGDMVAGSNDMLDTSEHSNIFVYIAGHGGDGFIVFGRNDPLIAEEFVEVIEGMYQDGLYRQMLIIVEACHGETMASDLDAPGVIYLTGAARNEPAFGCNYDRKMDTWLADDFTYQALRLLSRDPQLSILELYTTVYERVAGSHVRLLNNVNFGNVATTSIDDFISP